MFLINFYLLMRRGSYCRILSHLLNYSKIFKAKFRYQITGHFLKVNRTCVFMIKWQEMHISPKMIKWRNKLAVLLNSKTFLQVPHNKHQLKGYFVFKNSAMLGFIHPCQLRTAKAWDWQLLAWAIDGFWLTGESMAMHPKHIGFIQVDAPLESLLVERLRGGRV
jgi:hypothetical protein